VASFVDILMTFVDGVFSAGDPQKSEQRGRLPDAPPTAGGAGAQAGRGPQRAGADVVHLRDGLRRHLRHHPGGRHAQLLHRATALQPVQLNVPLPTAAHFHLKQQIWFSRQFSNIHLEISTDVNKIITCTFQK